MEKIDTDLEEVRKRWEVRTEHTVRRMKRLIKNAEEDKTPTT